MGAMHNDLERCQFMYSDDRRCRNLIETPTSPLCYYHNKSAQKKSDRSEANPATDAFFDWLSHHPLDTVTHINEALNQVFLLTVADRISARKADSLVRMARLLLKTVPSVRDEFRIPSLVNHSPGGERFLNEIRPTVLASALHPAVPGPDPAASDCHSVYPEAKGRREPSAVVAENLPSQAASPVPAPFHSDPAPAAALRKGRSTSPPPSRRDGMTIARRFSAGKKASAKAPSALPQAAAKATAAAATPLRNDAAGSHPPRRPAAARKSAHAPRHSQGSRPGLHSAAPPGLRADGRAMSPLRPSAPALSAVEGSSAVKGFDCSDV